MCVCERERKGNRAEEGQSKGQEQRDIFSSQK